MQIELYFPVINKINFGMVSDYFIPGVASSKTNIDKPSSIKKKPGYFKLIYTVQIFIYFTRMMFKNFFLTLIGTKIYN